MAQRRRAYIVYFRDETGLYRAEYVVALTRLEANAIIRARQAVIEVFGSRLPKGREATQAALLRQARARRDGSPEGEP